MTLLLIIGLVVCVVGVIAHRKPDPYHVPRRDVVPFRERRQKRRQWEDDWALELKRGQWLDDWDQN